MKKCWSFYFLFFFPVFLFAQTNDTTIQGVHIGFGYNRAIFPVSWQVSPISAKGEQIISEEIPRSKIIMTRALNKYPRQLLTYTLKAVYFLKSMTFYDVGYGGTNYPDTIY